MKKVIVFILLLSYSLLMAQNTLSSKAKVSVLTGGAGNELYTAFGHSAFRIYDPVIKIDKVYNYGTFDTSQPHFYLNFVKGKMTYVLSTVSFNSFLREYQYFGRSVKMQLLNLSPLEINRLYQFLETNALPKNRAYQYDFFYENCATKIESVLKTVLKDKVHFNNSHIISSKTHRQLLTDYTRKKFLWAGFGMDLVLGTSNDKKVTKDEYKFLPDYLFKALKNATIVRGGKQIPLVAKTYDILPEKSKKTNFFFTPTIVFLILSFLIVFISYKDAQKKKQSKWLDVVLHFSTGVSGVIILLLWLGTNHTTTYSNCNILWAFAPNIIIAFIVLKEKMPKWLISYYIILILGIIATFIIWIIGIQQFNIAILPFLIALIIRYLYMLNIKK